MTHSHMKRKEKNNSSRRFHIIKRRTPRNQNHFLIVRESDVSNSDLLETGFYKQLDTVTIGLNELSFSELPDGAVVLSFGVDFSKNKFLGGKAEVTSKALPCSSTTDGVRFCGKVFDLMRKTDEDDVVSIFDDAMLLGIIIVVCVDVLDAALVLLLLKLTLVLAEVFKVTLLMTFCSELCFSVEEEGTDKILVRERDFIIFIGVEVLVCMRLISESSSSSKSPVTFTGPEDFSVLVVDGLVVLFLFKLEVHSCDSLFSSRSAVTSSFTPDRLQLKPQGGAIFAEDLLELEPLR
uniref:Uncharacterized protein n=1 Tax=Glossina brevipalpis TaxID=37001 RepID=A0A1A9W175_9MUSC